MNLANTIKVMQLKQLQEAEEAAKYPHDMFDPETGEKEVANSEAEHKALAAKGYTHEKPEDEDEDEDEDALEEAMGSFSVPIPKQTLNGKKLGGGQPIVVKARTAREAITKAAKQLGVDFKFLKTGKVVKESVSLDEAFEAMLGESIEDTLKRIKKLGGSVYGDELTSKKDKTPARLAAQSRGKNKKTVYFVVTDDGHKEYKDLAAVKKDWNIAGNIADTKIAFELVNRQGDGDASDIIDAILNKYKINIAKLDKIANVALGAKSADDFLNESVSLDEQIRFKAGDMPNSELLTAIEKLKGLKAKAEGEKKKFDDPTLIDSVEQLIIGLEMGIKAGEKAEKQSSKFIAQAASVMNKAFALAKRKQHLLNSFEAEGDQLDEAYQQFTDKTPNWGEDQALTFGRKKGYKEVAVMSDNNSKHPMVLFALDSGDKKYIKGSNVKSGETVFRYATKISIAGDIFPLVKVNIAKGIYYNLTQESSEGTIEDAKFETKGVKLKFFRSLEGAIKESVELDEAKFGDNDLVHIAKANVRGNNNPKTDKIIGYSKAPKNPNKFPDPKSGANAIMRIADAKKKGFKVESVELNEDYFIVQYYDKKGKADTTKFSKFDDASKAKKYLDRANKTNKEGEYKMFKVKGAMEGLEEANVFGTQDNYGSSDSLLAAVNAVVSGQADTVEVSTDDTNVVVEQGVEAINEDNSNDKSDDGEGLDKVQPKAVKKKFKDRKDKDIDNDGDVDDSDKFLHKKRKAISKAISKDESKEKDDKKKDKKADEVDTSPSLDEGLKNPYKGKSSADLKRKLSSFESQLQDLIQKSKGRQRKEIEGEIRDMETKVQQVRSALKESCGLNEATFKSKYGSRWEAVMEATINRLAEQQELDEKFTLLKDKDIAPLVLALKDNISVELKDPKNNNLLVTMQTTDDGVQVKYKTGRNTKVGTERSPMPAIKSAVKFLKAKELAFREL